MSLGVRSWAGKLYALFQSMVAPDETGLVVHNEFTGDSPVALVDGKYFESTVVFDSILAGGSEYTLGITFDQDVYIVSRYITITDNGNSNIYAQVEVFEDSTITDNGTEIPVVNMNRDSSVVIDFKNYESPTVDVEGTLSPNVIRFKEPKQATAKETVERSYKLARNGNYLLKVTNLGDGAEDIHVIIHWVFVIVDPIVES